MKTNDPREGRLPKWARDLLDDARREAAAWRERAMTLEGDLHGSPIRIPRDAAGLPPLHLPGRRVVVEWAGVKLDVVCRRENEPIALYFGPVDYQRHGSVAISPQASNHIHLVPVGRGEG